MNATHDEGVTFHLVLRTRDGSADGLFGLRDLARTLPDFGLEAVGPVGIRAKIWLAAEPVGTMANDAVGKGGNDRE